MKYSIFISKPMIDTEMGLWVLWKEKQRVGERIETTFNDITNSIDILLKTRDPLFLHTYYS